VDGVCCGSACSEQCEACNTAGSLGACTPVTGAPAGARPPCADGVLFGSSPNPCSGTCNGTNAAACTYPGAETVCPNVNVCNDQNGDLNGGPDNCACKTGVMDVCDGQGSCFAPPSIRCPHPSDGGPEIYPDSGTNATGSGSGDAAPGTDSGSDAGTDSGAESGTGTGTGTGRGASGTGSGVGTRTGTGTGSGEEEDVGVYGGGCECRSGRSDASGQAWLAALAAGAFLGRGRFRGRRRRSATSGGGGSSRARGEGDA
jgi:hypothetical protein